MLLVSVVCVDLTLAVVLLLRAIQCKSTNDKCVSPLPLKRLSLAAAAQAQAVPMHISEL